VLREKSLLLDRLPGAPQTTNSRHSLPEFHNLVKDLELTGPNHAWAADITYIGADEGFLHLEAADGFVIEKNSRLPRRGYSGGRRGRSPSAIQTAVAGIVPIGMLKSSGPRGCR
jgi:hypothetical protein